MKNRPTGHPTPRTLVAFIEDDLPPRRRAAIGRHLAVCAECRAQISAARDLLEEIGASTPDGELAAWVDAYLSRVPDHRWPSLAAEDHRLQHVSVAQHLSARADGLYTRDPGAGLMYASTVTVIYERLAASGHHVSPELRTAAWRDQASFMLRCGRLSEYERAIERAYELAGDAYDPDHERAVLDLSRAIAFSEPDIGRLDEAIDLLASCTPIFVARGDVRRYRIAELRRGDVSMARSEIDVAAAVYESLLVSATDAERPQLLLRLGWCANESGAYSTALAMAYAARLLFSERAERPYEALADWLIGEALLRADRLSDAIGTLTGAEDQLAAVGISHEWVSVRLTRIEAMLAAKISGEMIRELCEEAANVSIALDQREPSRRHDCTAQALAFLRESAERDSLTLGMVQYVRSYVHRASVRPVPRFTPPSGMAIM